MNWNCHRCASPLLDGTNLALNPRSALYGA